MEFNKILVIVDMQNDFIDGTLLNPQAMDLVPRIVSKIEEEREDTLILFTRDTHIEEEYYNTKESKNVDIHCVRNTYGWEINEDIQKAFNRKKNTGTVIDPYLVNNTIYKYNYGSVELVEYLHGIIGDRKDVEIEFCGTATEVCVISNVMLVNTYFPNNTISVNFYLCAPIYENTQQYVMFILEGCGIEVNL